MIGEDLTKWPDQLDFSAELSKVKAAKPDALFVFYPGAAGVQFLNQYVQAGLKGQVPLYTAFTIDSLSLPRQGELALGVPGAQYWVNDLPNDANKKFVADFKAKHKAYPSFYGAQTYDAAGLHRQRGGGGQAATSPRRTPCATRCARPTTSRCAAPTSTATTTSRSRISICRTWSRMPTAMLTLKTVATIVKDSQDKHHDKCPMKW